MSRFRFTIRRMMVAVAIVGLLFGGEMARRRSTKYRALEQRYAMSELGARGALASAEVRANAVAWSGKRAAIRETGRDVAYERRRVEYLGAQRRRYRDAAAHPWLGPGPDPDRPAPR